MLLLARKGQRFTRPFFRLIIPAQRDEIHRQAGEDEGDKALIVDRTEGRKRLRGKLKCQLGIARAKLELAKIVASRCGAEACTECFINRHGFGDVLASRVAVAFDGAGISKVA